MSYFFCSKRSSKDDYNSYGFCTPQQESMYSEVTGNAGNLGDADRLSQRKTLSSLLKNNKQLLSQAQLKAPMMPRESRPL